MASPSAMPGSSAGSSSIRAVGAVGTWHARYHGNVRNGRFQVHGLAPDTEVPVYFLEPKRKLGAVVNLSVKSAAGGPVTVRLEPCGAARARLVDPDGKPVVGRLPRGIVTMVVTPGVLSSSANGQPVSSPPTRPT